MANKNINTILTLRDNFTGPLKKTAKTTKDFQNQLKRSGNQVKSFKNQASQNFKSLASTATKAFAGITAGFISIQGLKSTIDTYAQFEQAMANVSAVTGKTGQDLKQFESLAREMGKKTTKSATEAANAIEYMGLAGWDAKQITQGLEPILRLSEAGSLDLARASDLVTDSMSAMRLEVGESGEGLNEYLNKVAKASTKANAKVEQLLESYLGVGGVFANLNVPIEESAAILGKLADSGIKGSEAGNSLTSIMANLTAPTGQAEKALAKLGFSAYDSQGNFKGMINIMNELKGKLDALSTEEERNTMIAKIAGKTQTDTFNALLTGVGSYEELRDAINDSDGALLQMAETMNDTVKGKISIFNSAMDELKLKIGEKLAPTIKKLIEWFTVAIPQAFEIASRIGGKLKDVLVGVFAKIKEWAEITWTKIKQVIEDNKPVIDNVKLWFESLIPVFEQIKEFGVQCFEAMRPTLEWMINDAIPWLVQGFFDIVDVALQVYNTIKENWVWIEPVIWGIVGAVTAYKAIMIAQTAALTTYNVVQGIASAITGGWATAQGVLNALFIASPIGWICLAIGALVAIIILVVRNLDTLKQAWKTVWDNCTQVFKGVVNFFIKGINKMIGALNKLQFTVPDWVPGIGGKEFGFSINEIPEFALGTNYFTGGLAKINERGGEIVDLPNGTKVIPHQETKTMLNNVGKNLEKQPTQTTPTVTNNIEININGSQLTADEVIQQLVPKLKLAISNM